MRKFLLALCLLLPVGLVASQVISKDTVNTVLAEILQPLQDNNTKVGVQFNDLVLDAKSVTKLDLKFWLYRQALNNTFDLKIDRLNYDYSNVKNPHLNLLGSLNLDLVKVIGQEEINEIASDLELAVKDFSDEMLQEFEGAATASANVIEKTLDKSGNFQELKVAFSVSVDYALLPASKSIAEVEFKALAATVTFTPKHIDVSLDVMFNPDYMGYGDEVQGLKEHFQMLVDRDSDEMQSVQSAFYMALDFIDDVLAQDSSQP
ncbi:MAG: hypothetical protein KDD40_00350 [Bdellovibrionales bacterium]|nr:hypothetical protein [Bdellovibrionales bacterium]